MWQRGNAFSETPIAPLPHFDNAFSETPIAPLLRCRLKTPLPRCRADLCFCHTCNVVFTDEDLSTLTNSWSSYWQLCLTPYVVNTSTLTTTATPGLSATTLIATLIATLNASMEATTVTRAPVSQKCQTTSQKCQKMTQISRKCRNMSENVEICRNMSENVRICRKMSQNVRISRNMSQNVEIEIQTYRKNLKITKLF